MDIHGRTAREYWAENRPVELAALQDPAGFFAQMGDEIAGQIAELTENLVDRTIDPDDFVARVADGNAAALRAQEIVYAERFPVE